MIRYYNNEDLDEINSLLSTLNYQLSADSFNNDFLNILVYVDKSIEGVLVYTSIYDRIEIEYIVVSDKYKRCGIATKLINYIEKKYNIKNITLEVRESNKIAIKFYKKNGFKVVTTRKNYYNNEDAYLMIKEIGD